ncbi:unnamed protein product [Mytilus edulis]|uniref:Uncharacterized protein n=1 Tax=Mytilus edulis TaxID=6550 RepID=A0A8S3RJM3_MYTED|nr:unnamed protein product [Mytilus edulis]
MRWGLFCFCNYQGRGARIGRPVTIREGVPGWEDRQLRRYAPTMYVNVIVPTWKKMVTENPLYKGRHHLSKTTRVRLVSALRCAIRFRSKELKEQTVDVSTAIKRLRHDIINSVNHVFGQHDHCSDFCRAKTQQTDTSSDINTCTSSNSDHSTASSPTIVKNSDEPDLLDCQIDFWSEGSSLASQEESRLGTTIQYSNVEQHIIKDVLTLLNRIAEKSDRLISNSTTNLAESWMHIRTKFDGGKVYNLCNRGSWHARCYGGALRMNLDPQWSCQAWETCTATEPGKHFTARYKRNEQIRKKFQSFKMIELNTALLKKNFNVQLASLQEIKATSTDKDQMTYINARLEDIELLAEGTNYKGITFKDKIRICSGDNPARQFESGQQRVGQYSCLCGVESKSHINLELCFKHKQTCLEIDELDNNCEDDYSIGCDKCRKWFHWERIGFDNMLNMDKWYCDDSEASKE